MFPLRDRQKHHKRLNLKFTQRSRGCSKSTDQGLGGEKVLDCTTSYAMALLLFFSLVCKDLNPKLHIELCCGTDFSKAPKPLSTE